jgi:hypothetical protein
MTEHTHGDSAPHDHEGDAPGHTHDAPTTAGTTPVAPVATTAATTTAPVGVGPSAGGLSMRIILTLLGAALMIGGAFLTWFNFGDVPEGALVPGGAGTELNWSILYSTESPFGTPDDPQGFFTSIGFVAIILGLLALLGLALSTGWLTRVAGVLGILIVVAYAITLYRVEGEDLSISQVGLGAWLVVLGGLIVLIAGFLGSRRVVTAQVPAA